MAAVLRRIGKIIAAGLAYAARTTALHEGLPWADDVRPTRAGRVERK